MTIGFVRKLLTLSENDPVLTAYGSGVVVGINVKEEEVANQVAVPVVDSAAKDQEKGGGAGEEGGSGSNSEESSTTAAGGPVSTEQEPRPAKTKITTTAYEIKLDYGTLHAVAVDAGGGGVGGRSKNGGGPEGAGGASTIHKIITPEGYATAMEKLEEYRTMQLEIRCQELNIEYCSGGGPSAKNGGNNNNNNNIATCVGCLFGRPENTGKASSNQQPNNKNDNSAGARRKVKKRKATPCDVCGNPTCRYHVEPSADSSSFMMCLDCSHDLDRSLDDNLYSSGLCDTVVRLLNMYDRMMVQLSFCVPTISVELAGKMSNMQLNKSRMSLGTSGLSFVSGALGVAGAATVLTPVGLPLLIAAIATSGSAATVQGGYQMAVQTSEREAGKMADRIVGWHGLCYTILKSLESLRQMLVHIQEQRIEKEVLKQQQQGGPAAKGNSNKSKQSKYVDSASRVSSMGAKVTSVAASAGATGSNLTPMLQTSLQMTPIVGAVLSVGVMALDGHNIATTLKNLSQPHAMALVLDQIRRSFCVVLPTSVEEIALILLEAVREIRQKEDEDLRVYAEALFSQSDEDQEGPADDGIVADVACNAVETTATSTTTLSNVIAAELSSIPTPLSAISDGEDDENQEEHNAAAGSEEKQQASTSSRHPFLTMGGVSKNGDRGKDVEPCRAS